MGADNGAGGDWRETLCRAVERGEKRAHLETILRKGEHAAKTLLKARILLKADVSEAGDGLSDGAIIAQLETNASHAPKKSYSFKTI